MIIHELKIEQIHLARILEGDKMFEIRNNDRSYQVGDTISFIPLDSDLIDVYQIRTPIPKYRITSLYSGYGLQEGFVVLGIKEK